MKRYRLDTGIAGYYIDRRRGVFERAQTESGLGNWIGIAHPVLGELAYRVEGSGDRVRNLQRLHVALSSWKLWPVTQEAAAASELGLEATPRYGPRGRPRAPHTQPPIMIAPGIASRKVS
ncbi:MAG TPA: hypothetical protein VGY66_20895 [Gemmataceae bacterium]|jgi:hypothetical protein|nr:hypothetical protein [Gemmataceae bacterium]